MTSIEIFGLYYDLKSLLYTIKEALLIKSGLDITQKNGMLMLSIRMIMKKDYLHHVGLDELIASETT
jgi:hypothetical protein